MKLKIIICPEFAAGRALFTGGWSHGQVKRRTDRLPLPHWAGRGMWRMLRW